MSGSTLTITSDMEVDFEWATYEAMQNSQESFTFHDYLINTAKAIDTVQALQASRTYH